MKTEKEDSSFSIFNNPELKKIIIKIPFILVFLLSCIFPPVGIYILVIKTKNKKKKMYKIGETLTIIGGFIFAVTAISIYGKIKEIIVLYDTGMSLDMIDVSIGFWDVFGIVAFVALLTGGIKLIVNAKLMQKYTTLINVEKKISIKTISKEVKKDIDETINDIADLIDKGYLQHVKIDESKKRLIYEDNNENSNDKAICKKCGAIEQLKSQEYHECDFCGQMLSNREL